jgi:lipocalin
MNKFPLGQIVATPGALEALEQSGQTPDFFLAKHASGDWGEVCNGDKKLNDEALVDGSRLLSAYRTLKNERIWVITEAADEDGHRVATTCLLPEEY